jgi:rhodanese-related sulfurtransferase
MMTFHLDYSDLKRVIAEATIIVCFGITIGLAFNYQLIMNAFEGKVVTSPEIESTANLFPVPVSLDEVQKLSQRAIIIDARITELYAEGHLPNAISLPWADIEHRLAAFKGQYRDRSLIIYCSGYGCSDSFDLALLLLENGYHDVMVYEGGFPEWRDSGLPVEGGQP